MKVLTPYEVFFLAETVYAIRVTPESVIKDLYKGRQHRNFPAVASPFDPSTLNAFQGHSGIRFKNQSLKFLGASSGFGFMARRESAGTPEFVLVTRGTDQLPDWLTDANSGVAVGPNSKLVHTGFNDTFNSYRAQLEILLGQAGPPPAVIHCVGHSLGGALANLNAALLHERGYTVCLYTLGAPRVGCYPFATDLEKKLHNRVYRVVNRFDPVGMVPVFPFCHAAQKADTYIIHSGGNIISPDAHSVDPTKPGYAVQMNRASRTWADLKQPLARVGALHETLDDSIKILGSALLFNGQLLILIGQAIYSLCSKISQAALITTQRFMDGCAEAMDRLAELLILSAAQTFIMNEEAKAILRAIAQFLGRGNQGFSGEPTVTLVRWALQQLNTELQTKANLAIRRRY